MKVFRLIFILTLSVYLYSCSSESSYKEHESGLKYKYIVHDENAEKPAEGDILELKMAYRTKDDSVVEASDFFRMQLTEPTHTGGSIEDALSLLHVGDSAKFIIDAYSFYVETRKIELPDFILPGDPLYFDLKLINFLKFEEFEQERSSIKSTNEKEEENLLRTFLKRTNVKVEPTTSGLYFISLKQGSNVKPVPGKKVKVHYYGYFIDGRPFDNSYEQGDPIEFVLGAGQVIPGWDEGISMLTIGQKAKLIIPSYLAYGDKQRGPIPPFSTLVFEVELVDAEQ